MTQDNSIYSLYEYYLKQGDSRLTGWMTMDTPVYMSSFVVLYLLTIWSIRNYMINRPPYKLKYFLILYSFCQSCGSLYMFIEIGIVAYHSRYSIICQPVDYSNDPLAIRMLNVLWYFYFSKLVDLIDTVAFALRKKDNQITYLHVFHHFTMVPMAWFGLKYVGGGNTFFLCLFNSFVHFVMYFYYCLSACGPYIQKHLNVWKKPLTTLQLIQFFAVMFHSIVNIYADCSFPALFSIAYLIYGIIITCFFINFYIQSYIIKEKRQIYLTEIKKYI